MFIAEVLANQASKKVSEAEKKSHIFPQFLFRPSDADFAADNVVSSQWRDYRNSPPEEVKEPFEHSRYILLLFFFFFWMR